MIPSEPEYQNHTVFSDLARYVAFYRQLAESVFPWVEGGTTAMCNIDSYVFSSIQGTLESVQTVLRAGRINDAYALLRKYFDSAIISVYSCLYLEDHYSIDNFIVEQVNNWVTGRTRLPEYRIMSQYIRSSSRVASITMLLFADDRYKRLRDRCNDHTHYNFYRTLLLNDNEISIRGRIRTLDEFAADVRDVLILHVAYVFSIKQHYMASSDFVDCLDCGMTPEPNSQYWVAPFVQDVFDNAVTKYRPDVANAIKDRTSMHLA